MGTFDSSKIKVARQSHDCIRCKAQIMRGDKYLSYALGLKNRIKEWSKEWRSTLEEIIIENLPAF